MTMSSVENVNTVGDLTIKVTYESWNERYRPHSVMTTFNGYQWTGMSFNSKEEVIALRDTLNEYIWNWGWE
jgi:hypothetical protein